MPDPESFETFFGPDYFEIYRDLFPAEKTAAEVEGVVALLGLPPGARVLDLACGQGRHTRLLRDLGYIVEAVDRDAAMLAELCPTRSTSRCWRRWAASRSPPVTSTPPTAARSRCCRAARARGA